MLVLCCMCLAAAEILFVSELFRHGARNPLEPFPGMEGQPGQLTSVGLRQEYLLGWQLSHLYQELIGNENGCACFQDGDELSNAVQQFYNAGCSDEHNCNNDMVQKYGWPIGSWCVSQVTDMNSLYYLRMDFQRRYFRLGCLFCEEHD